MFITYILLTKSPLPSPPTQPPYRGPTLHRKLSFLYSHPSHAWRSQQISPWDASGAAMIHCYFLGLFNHREYSVFPDHWISPLLLLRFRLEVVTGVTSSRRAWGRKGDTPETRATDNKRGPGHHAHRDAHGAIIVDFGSAGGEKVLSFIHAFGVTVTVATRYVTSTWRLPFLRPRAVSIDRRLITPPIRRKIFLAQRPCKPP